MNQITEQEHQANKYTCQIIRTHGIQAPGEESTFGAQSFWQEMVLNHLKNKALVFIGQTLKQLAINHLVDLASWLLEQLEGYLLTKYQEASPEEKEVFKQKIEEKFPHSGLAQRL